MGVEVVDQDGYLKNEKLGDRDMDKVTKGSVSVYQGDLGRKK